MDTNVVNQVLGLTLMMVIGGYLRKRQIMSDVVMKAFTDVLLSVTVPCMVIYSFHVDYSREMLDNGIMMFSSALVIHIFLIILSKLLYYKFDPLKRNILLFSTVFSNCGFIGFPLLYSLYGTDGVFYTSIFVACFNLFAFSYGVMLFTGKTGILKSLKSLFLNPPLIATVVGIFIFICGIKLPKAPLITLHSVGDMTTAISMFIIGAMLADVKLKEALKGIDVFYLCVMKLIVAPFLCYFLLKPFISNQTIFTIAVILVAMPTGSLTGVFAEKYNGNRSLASRCTFVTTVLSMITIPLVISLL